MSLRKVEVQPTSACNYRCFYCIGTDLFGEKAAILPKGALTQLAKGLIAADPRLVVISGMRGEPLLNPYTGYFMRQLKDGPSKKQHIGLYTNGTKLYGEIRDILVSNNRAGDYVNIHLSAHPWTSYQAYQEIHGANAIFQGTRVLHNVDALTNRREQKNSMLYIRINFLATAQNSRDLAHLEKFLKSLAGFGVDAIRVSIPIEPKLPTAGKKFFLTEGQIDELRSFQSSLSKLECELIVEPKRLVRISWGKNPFTHCFAKDTAFAISPDGKAAPCCYTTYPAFPFRAGIFSEELGKLAQQMRRLKFNPQEICPPCSRTDYLYNSRRTREEAARKK